MAKPKIDAEIALHEFSVRYRAALAKQPGVADHIMGAVKGAVREQYERQRRVSPGWGIEEPKIEAPKIEAPAIDAPKITAPTAEAFKVEAPAIEEPKIAAPKIERPKIQAPRIEPPKIEGPEPEI